MELLECRGCGSPLEDGERFCGNCGTAVTIAKPRLPWPGTGAGASGDQQMRERRTADSGPFFLHAPARPAGRPSNATRYLCAAVYLNPSLANLVVAELIGSHRAVVPSVDFDLRPIIRHCLSARRMALIRDLVLTAILAAGLFLAPVSTILAATIAFVMGFFPGGGWGRSKLGGKLLALGAIVAVIGIVVTISIVEAARSLLSGGGQFGAASPSGGFNIAAIFILLALTGATQLAYSYARFRTLSAGLRPDARPARFAPSSPRVEARIEDVGAAQGGNITLYEGENPFLGAGRKASRVWSIAIELDRARPSRDESLLRPQARGYVPIDPVELHQVIRDRVLKLKDPGLPPNERISALTVDDHVVGEGRRRWDGQLIDPVRKIPYSQASQEAIEALIRHPQAGLRYYQRVSVSDKGQPVVSGDREVIEGSDQGIVVSAFVHLAVEGRMFYLEFVTTVLPPIQRRYQVIDQLPVMSSGTFLGKVIAETARSLFSDLLRAPLGVAGTLRLMMREQRAYDVETASSSDFVFADIGARTSVRELGADANPHTYIQVLDSQKYTKIIERLLTETVLDFLAAKGVDTSAFATSSSTIVNGTVAIGNTMFGPSAFGAGAMATQNLVPAQPTASAPG